MRVWNFKSHIGFSGYGRFDSQSLRRECKRKIFLQRGDLRDAKLSVTPEGKLMLLGAVAYPKPHQHSHQSLAWFSDAGTQWSKAAEVADPNFWLWRVTWHKDQCLGIGYSTTREKFIRLYKSEDGKNFETVVPKLAPTDYPNESAILFEKDGTALCLLRRDPANGLFGRAEPPHTNWEWQDVGMRVGGPALIELPDGRLIGAVRLYGEKVRTSLIELDRSTGKAKEILSFPSGGDTSYPGLVWHDGRLWMSYYSSHEGKTSIYLATVTL